MIVCTQSYLDISPSWIIALLLRRGLWNSIKLWAMPCKTIQDGQVIVESSGKKWSTGGGNGNPLQYSCHKNPMYSLKRQRYMTLEDEPSWLESVQYATGEKQMAITNSFRKKEVDGPKGKWCLFVDMPGDERKVWCSKGQCCIGTWNVRSMNQGKLEVVKQEMTRLNIDILVNYK